MKKNIKQKKNKSKDKINLTRFILVIIIIISTGILLGVMSYTEYAINKINKNNKILSVHTVDASAIIVQYGAGLNGDKDALKFGKVPLEGSSIRFLKINNSNKAIVHIEMNGEIAQFLSVDKNDFLLEKNIEETVSFQLDVPYNAIVGTYEGTVKVIFLKP